MFSEYLDPHICVSKEGSLNFKHRLESHRLRIEREDIKNTYFPKLEQKLISHEFENLNRTVKFHEGNISCDIYLALLIF